MAKLRWVLVLALCLDSVTASQWSVPMISNYFDAIHVHYIDALVCSDRDAINLFKSMTTCLDVTTRKDRVLFRIIHSMEITAVGNARTGIFLDLSCAQNVQLLQNIKSYSLFESNIAWFIWDQEGLLSSGEWHLPIYTFSDVVVADNVGLQQIRKIWRSLPIERSAKGQWSNEMETYTLYPTESKFDMKGSDLRGAITFVQDIYDRNNLESQLRDVHYRPGFDIANRFYHANMVLFVNLYNFKMRLTVGDDWGDRKPNGSWNGMLGMLQRKEIDLAVTPMMPISYRMEVAIPTLSLVPYWIAVVFKQPRALGTYKAMLLELSTGTWVCVFGLIVVGAISFSFTQIYEPGAEYDSDGSFAMGVVQSVGIIANQGLCFMPKGTSSRIVCFSLLVVGLIVSTYYSAATMTALLSPSPPIIKSLDDLLLSNIPITFRNASNVRIVSVRLKLFPEKLCKLLAPPGVKLWELFEGTQLIANGSAFVDEYFVLFQNINSHLKSNVVCDLDVFKASQYSFLLIYIKKDPHFRELFVRGVSRLFEHGLVHKERQRWIADRLGCSRMVQFIHVQMEAVSVAFVVFTIGFILCVMFYVMEVFIARRAKPKKSNLLGTKLYLREY